MLRRTIHSPLTLSTRLSMENAQDCRRPIVVDSFLSLLNEVLQMLAMQPGWDLCQTFDFSIRDEILSVYLITRDKAWILDVILIAVTKEVTWVTIIAIKVFPNSS